MDEEITNLNVRNYNFTISYITNILLTKEVYHCFKVIVIYIKVPMLIKIRVGFMVH